MAASALLDRVPSWAGRGSRSPMEAAVTGKEQKQTEQDLGKVAQHCFCSLFYFGPLFLSLYLMKIGSTTAESSHHMMSTYIFLS